jgi:2-aminoethylphosphonate transport system permease protein
VTTLIEEPFRTSLPSRRSRAHWWVLPPLLLVLLAAAYPLLRVLGESTRPGAFTQVLGSAQFREALWRTVAIAVTSTLGCLILGSFLAVVLAFVPFPGSGLVGGLIDTVLALPSFLITLAFTFLYGTAGVLNAALGLELTVLYTPAGVIAAEITFFTPFVVRPLLAAFALIPAAQLNIAASLGASPWRVLRAVVLPEAWPALLAGGSLVLLLTLNEFGIVLFTGAKGVLTLPVLIYTRGIVTFDLPGAAVIATVQVVLSLTLYLGYRMIFARMTSGRRGRGVAVEPAK